MPKVFSRSRLNRTMSTSRVLLLSSITLGLLVANAHSADVYRYKSGGSVTYGDHVPSMGLDDGHSVLSSQGVVLKEVKSREERRVARQQEQQAMVVRLRDKTLLKTFTTEEDILRTREDRLGLLDGQIERLEDRVRISKQSLANVDQRIRQAEGSGGNGTAPSALYAEKDRIKSKMQSTWAQIDSKAADRRQIATKFDSDLIRYRWLKNGQGAQY